MLLRSSRETSKSTTSSTYDQKDPQPPPRPSAAEFNHAPAFDQARASDNAPTSYHAPVLDNTKLECNLAVILLLNVVLVLITDCFICAMHLLTPFTYNPKTTMLAISLAHTFVSLVRVKDLKKEELLNPLFSNPSEFHVCAFVAFAEIIRTEVWILLGGLLYWTGILNGVLNCAVVLAVIAVVLEVTFRLLKK